MNHTSLFTQKNQSTKCRCCLLVDWFLLDSLRLKCSNNDEQTVMQNFIEHTQPLAFQIRFSKILSGDESLFPPKTVTCRQLKPCFDGCHMFPFPCEICFKKRCWYPLRIRAKMSTVIPQSCGTKKIAKLTTIIFVSCSPFPNPVTNPIVTNRKIVPAMKLHSIRKYCKTYIPPHSKTCRANTTGNVTNRIKQLIIVRFPTPPASS